jgi:serine/threonine protein kinase
MIFLSGYGIKKLIYRGTRNDYYLAERKKDGRPVTIKVHDGTGADSGENEIGRFTHEHDILSRIHFPGVPESYGIERYRGGYALILEALSGSCLAEWDGMNGLRLRDALAIGSKISGILSGLHTNRVIHQGIKPEAIFYAPESDDVWLLGFDGASFGAQLAQPIPQPGTVV